MNKICKSLGCAQYLTNPWLELVRHYLCQILHLAGFMGVLVYLIYIAIASFAAVAHPAVPHAGSQH